MIGDPAAAVVVGGGILATLFGAVALYRALAPHGGRGRRLWLPAALVAGAVALGIGALVYHARDGAGHPRVRHAGHESPVHRTAEKEITP